MSGTTKNECSDPASAQAIAIMTEFFSAERLQALTYLLLSRFLPMSTEELEEWEVRCQHTHADAAVSRILSIYLCSLILSQ